MKHPPRPEGYPKMALGAAKRCSGVRGRAEVRTVDPSCAGGPGHATLHALMVSSVLHKLHKSVPVHARGPLARWGVWVAVVCAACTADAEPAGLPEGSSTTGEAGDTMVGPTTLEPATTTPATSTTEAVDSSSTGEDPSTSSGAATSTGADATSTGGCEVGTLDCACGEGELCDDGLVCDDEVCSQPPNCPQERSEPNDTEDLAPLLDDLNDFNPNFETVDGRLPNDEDVDWFSYHCDDTAGGQVDMNYEMDAPGAVRVCQYIACDAPLTPVVDCPEEADSELSPGGLPGCCSYETELFVPDIDCSPDDNDDSGVIFLRVDMPVDNICLSYDLGFHC